MMVHPAFDTSARVWFTDDGVEAKTLAELQRKLPKAKIVGYYPNGYNGTLKAVSLPPPPMARVPNYSATKPVQPLARLVPVPSRHQAPSLFPEPALPDEPLKEFPPVEFRAKVPGTTELPGVAPKFSKPIKEAVNEAPACVADAPQPLPVLPVEALQADSVEHREVVSPPTSEAGPAPGATRLIQEGSALRPFTPALYKPKPTPTPRRRYTERGYVESKPWTKEQIRDLKRMVRAEGLSDREIARRIGRTKNAVIGRRHRSGIFLPRK